MNLLCHKCLSCSKIASLMFMQSIITSFRYYKLWTNCLQKWFALFKMRTLVDNQEALSFFIVNLIIIQLINIESTLSLIDLSD